MADAQACSQVLLTEQPSGTAEMAEQGCRLRGNQKAGMGEFIAGSEGLQQFPSYG
jgi:hypothetical protein